MTKEKELKIYKEFIEAINMAHITGNSKWLSQLIENACNLSYSYRRGNGEYSEEEQLEIIDKALTNLVCYPKLIED